MNNGDLPYEAITLALTNGLRKPKPKRKRVTFQERTAPCEWCKHPLSHRHHVHPIGDFGVNDEAIQVCANCHELYHIAYNSWFKHSIHAAKLFLQAYNGADTLHRELLVAPVFYVLELSTKITNLNDQSLEKWIPHIRALHITEYLDFFLHYVTAMVKP